MCHLPERPPGCPAENCSRERGSKPRVSTPSPGVSTWRLDSRKDQRTPSARAAISVQDVGFGSGQSLSAEFRSIASISRGGPSVSPLIGTSSTNVSCSSALLPSPPHPHPTKPPPGTKNDGFQHQSVMGSIISQGIFRPG